MKPLYTSRQRPTATHQRIKHTRPGPSQSDPSIPKIKTTIGKNCKNAEVRALRQKIIEIGLPKEIQLKANLHAVEDVKQRNKIAMKCRFYPISELRRLLTIQVVESILNHDCPDYCDQQRQYKEKLSPPFDVLPERHTNNKTPEQSAQWAEDIVNGFDQLSSLLTIFGLLVTIKRPLLIIGFLKRGVHDGDFPRICELATEETLIREYWENFHAREPTAGNKAATVFRKQMWSFIPPIMIHESPGRFSRLKILEFKPQRILPIVSYKFLGKGGYSQVYAVKIHKDYCHPPPEFKVCVNSKTLTFIGHYLLIANFIKLTRRRRPMH